MEADNEVVAQRPPVRLGIAGLGRAALFNHIPAFKALPGLYRLVAVCDLMKERRDIIEKDYPDVHMYRRVEDMLDDPDIDLVLITLPTTDHVACALSSLRRGRWTVVEAPLATTHEDAKMLQAASANSSPILRDSSPRSSVSPNPRSTTPVSAKSSRSTCAIRTTSAETTGRA